jgi:hypothetical protein
MDDKTLLNVLRRIIHQETIWLRHYIGQIKNVTDPQQKGRVNVAVFDLGYNSEDNGFWCFPRDKNALITPKNGDWVEVYFINGDRNKPVYLGVANEMENMLPKSYDGKETTQVIFEDVDNKIRILYDASNNSLNVGNKNFQPCARKDDETLSDNTSDSNFWTYMNLIATHVHPGIGAPSPTLATAPSSLKGKINEGSDQINVGDK